MSNISRVGLVDAENHDMLAIEIANNYYGINSDIGIKLLRTAIKKDREDGNIPTVPQF